MNTGLVSSRYASALLKFTEETGNGKTVYRQVLALHRRMMEVPGLRAAIDNPMSIPDSRKFELLVSALGDEPMAMELDRFIHLVMKNGRVRCLRFIFLSFIFQYRQAHNIKVGKLVTAVPAPELEKRISSIARERKGETVVFEHRVDPEIIGGFIFEIDGHRLDASTASQLKTVKRQFVEKNRRIV